MARSQSINTRSVVYLVVTLVGLLSADQWDLAMAGTLTASAANQIAAIVAEKGSRTPIQQKIDSQLLYAARIQSGQPAVQGLTQLRSSVEPNASGAVLVDISAEVTDQVLSDIRSLGGSIINSFPQYAAIRASLPLLQVEKVAAIPEVSFIGPAERSIVNKVVSEGDITHRANVARSSLAVNGSGITVGVISNAVDQLATLQAAGDLPPNCPAGPPCVSILPGQAGSGNSEGTAMMEIVNSLAPGANLIFATGNGGVANMANNIVGLKNAGAKVIVDDETYFAEPIYQDGTIAQAVNTVVSASVAYFSSAANDGNKANGTSGTWEGDYSGASLPGVLTGTGVSALDFGGGNTGNIITQNPSTQCITLKWSDPIGGSGNDYDLYMLDPTGTNIQLSSTNAQTCTQDPLESICGYTGNATNFQLVVVLFSGQARFMHLSASRGRLEFNTGGATYGHNAGANTVSVAAVNVATAGCPSCVPFVGGTTNPVETFSSDGPRRIFYQPNGTAITPGNFLSTGGALLVKPDVTGADGVSCATTGFSPFLGTSAAAPHIAAIAALLLSQNPNATPARVKQSLIAASLHVTDPSPGFLSGAGIVDAYLAATAGSPFFNGESPQPNNLFYLAFPDATAFGYYSYQYFPFLYHFGLGFEYVYNARDAAGGVFFYDFGLNTFLYTNPNFFPFFFDYGGAHANHWLYYYNGTSRYFTDTTTNQTFFSAPG